MKNNLDNHFISKFDLLNSQENSEVIIWSSDSSDYDNSVNNENVNISTQNMRYKKRKRLTSKRKTSKNISHLNITFIESEQKNKKIIESPVSSRKKTPKLDFPLPILTSSERHFLPLNLDKSPIILNRTKSCNVKEESNSPVLSYKHISSINSPKVRKKLFNPNNVVEKAICEERSKSPVLSLTQKSIFITSNSNHTVNTTKENSSFRNVQKLDNKLISLDNNIDYNIDIDYNLPKFKSSVPLIDKVKSYFDSHFSSNTSQSASISDCDTEYERNSIKSHNDIEILNSQTENLEPIVELERKQSLNSLSGYDNDFKFKKVKYKKDGLAFRLNALKKKQSASTSLWLHERFLAANSSFILPSEVFLIFRIRTICIKYGCYLIEALDVNKEKYLIILNNIDVHNTNKEKDAVLKVYKPYNIIECTDYKLIINLCKYECVILENK